MDIPHLVAKDGPESVVEGDPSYVGERQICSKSRNVMALGDLGDLQASVWFPYALRNSQCVIFLCATATVLPD